MSDHAFLAPSSAAKWVQCALSASLEAAYPDVDSNDTREGTAAHWAGAELAENRVVGRGQYAPNGVVLTDEMIEAAEMWVDHMFSITGGPAGIVTEKRVNIPRVHERNWGTPDARAWLPCFNLHVWDFKYGHKFVDAYKNWQMIDYVAGILDEAAVWHRSDEEVTVHMHVVQPRNYHPGGPIRTWTIKASDLRTYFNRLEMAANAACGPNPVATTNDECIHCKGRRACAAAQQNAYRIADMSSTDVPFDLSPSAAGLELTILHAARERLNARITGLEGQVEASLTSGVSVPFWSFVSAPGRERWTQPADVVVTTGAVLGLNLAKPAEPITPNQARKLGMDPAMVAAFSDRPAMAKKLVPVNDDTARRVFGN